MEEMKMSDLPNVPNEEEFLERVEKAARKGAASGTRKGRFLSLIPLLLLIALTVFLYNRITGISHILDRDTPVEGHDLTLENHGPMGYTVADFAEAVLGDSQQLKKLEVYTVNISDATTLTNTGLLNFKVFTKSQILTYHGIATYTVDLTGLNEDSFKLDEENKKLIMYIPHTVLETINVPSDQIEFGDTERGFLAFGDIKLTQEESAKVQTEARTKMEEKLTEEKTSEEADRFAKMSVWELYQPIISNMDPEYQLEIEFTE
jgi:hypothetical protein